MTHCVMFGICWLQDLRWWDTEDKRTQQDEQHLQIEEPCLEPEGISSGRSGQTASLRWCPPVQANPQLDNATWRSDTNKLKAFLPSNRRDGLWELHIENGFISSIAPVSESVHPVAVNSGESEAAFDNSGQVHLDAAGRLCLPGFVDAHNHLDKACIAARCAVTTGDFQEALRETLIAKRAFTEEDIFHRARAVVEKAISFGTTLMRTHAEVDHILGLVSVRALLRLRDTFADEITIQVAAFAQEGITNIDDEVNMLRAALSLGCDAVGSAPYVDPDAGANIRTVFGLAQEFDCDVDFHLDYHLGTDKPSLLEEVLDETMRRGWQGRVCLGHVTSLSSLPPVRLSKMVSRMNEASVAVLALPASDVYMMARSDTHDVRRGVCPVHLLKRQGLCAAFATNNVKNLFDFTGDGDVLKVGTLLSQILQLSTPADHCDCLEMATSDAARSIGVEHRLDVGARADIVVLDCSTATDALAAPPVARTVIKGGRVVSETSMVSRRFKGGSTMQVTTLSCGARL